MDLCLPAFYQKKPTYEDLAEFVYSVLSVGGTSPPQVVRAGVQDIQLQPVKKLLFIKFAEQQLRDEVVTRKFWMHRRAIFRGNSLAAQMVFGQ